MARSRAHKPAHIQCAYIWETEWEVLSPVSFRNDKVHMEKLLHLCMKAAVVHMKTHTHTLLCELSVIFPLKYARVWKCVFIFKCECVSLRLLILFIFKVFLLEKLKIFSWLCLYSSSSSSFFVLLWLLSFVQCKEISRFDIAKNSDASEQKLGPKSFIWCLFNCQSNSKVKNTTTQWCICKEWTRWR